MTNQPKHLRQFIHLSRAWYKESSLQGRDFTDEVMFGLYDLEGGTSGEMAMRWIALDNGHRPSPRLEVFDDAFHLLQEFKDVMQELSLCSGKLMEPEEFCRLLSRCGFSDNTPTENPHAQPEEEQAHGH